MRRALLIAGIATLAVTAFAQLPWREYEGDEYNNFPAPTDYNVPAEYVFGRLMYPQGNGGGFGRRGFRDWRQGGRTAWTNDYPRADRHLLSAVRRLTRVDARSVEQPINLEDGDDIYNWPMLYMVRAGFSDLTPEMSAKLRDYIARGGFLVADDMWGLNEWGGFANTMKQVMPGKDFNEIPDSDALWHIAFDLTNRYQILGQWSRFNGGQPLNQGYTPHWRGIWDEKKERLLVAAWVNCDTGDSWEWADDPSYPEKYSALGIRMVVNHILYAMSH
jgi:Domain of unknown function (DUF4159)